MLHFKSLSLVILFIVTLSCNSQSPVPFDTMQEILAEMHLAEAAAMYVPKDTNAPRSQDSLLYYQAQILKRHHVSEKEFLRAVNYYQKYPIILDSIYLNILSTYATMQTNANK